MTQRSKRRGKEEKSPLLEPIRLISMIGVYGTTASLNQVTVTLDVRGKHMTAQEKGVGPVAAIGHAIQKIYPHDARMTKFKVVAEADGLKAEADSLDAKGEVQIALTIPHGGTFEGKCSNPDTFIGIATAYLQALNAMCEFIEKRNRHIHRNEHPNENLGSRAAM